MPIKTFSTEVFAAAYVNYLNGGSGDFRSDLLATAIPNKIKQESK